ncbi:DUF3667 domain-containing protein [Caulobacter segnis]|uniref:Uncharacterized protein n=2 Tax=Caulobacter segnis TaxID=88688 RepID=D5VL93_CAUST|nr:DUF3667 domain-containing protein [Caulobacter segnis]ADG11266.1 conserved hypothetical protein [Caulobacter segnis ATCC 21756]AVQ02941.1 DUF3667 domain-containing protein [Caulobacter segnis]
MVTGAELEAVAADSAGSFARSKKKPFPHKGEPCKNCGTPLEGWYCYSCGQNADTHHRSILHLIWETIEGMFHLDGRLANTLPLLFFKPGVLAKDLMEGRIARHAPPFRTFLVALLLFIFAAEHAIHNIRHEIELKEEKEIAALATPAGRKAKADEMRKDAAETRDSRLSAAVEVRDEALKEAGADKAEIAADYDERVKKAQDRYAAKVAEADALEKNPNAAAEAKAKIEKRGENAAEQIRGLDLQEVGAIDGDSRKIGEANIGGQHFNVVTPDGAAHKEVKADIDLGKTSKGYGFANGFKEGLAKAIANPDYYILVMFGWAHRLAVLLLPIIGLSLALVYVNRRQFYIYDHLLVATNLLSFAFLTNAIGMVLPASLIGPWFAILTFWTPINLFQTLRGGYGSTVVGAIFKTLIVWFMSVFAFALLITALMLFTLTQM